MNKTLKIEIVPSFSGEIRDVSSILDEALAAGWSDDPGQGKAVLIKDDNGNPAYEVFNPMGFAPPIGFEPTPPIDQLIRERVALEVERLRDDEEIDSEDEVNDFDVPDELPPLETYYEVIAMEPTAPSIPKTKDPAERAKEYLDLEETVTRERLLRKRHREAALEKQRQEHDELYAGTSLTDRGSDEDPASKPRRAKRNPETPPAGGV